MSVDDPLVACNRTIAHLHERLNYQRTGVLLRQAPTDRLAVYTRCTQGLSPDQQRQEIARINGLLMANSNGVVRQTLKTQRPIMLNSAHLSDQSIKANANMRSEACFPLIANGQCLGVIDTESEVENKFNWDDYTLMMSISSQLAQILARNWNDISAALFELPTPELGLEEAL